MESSCYISSSSWAPPWHRDRRHLDWHAMVACGQWHGARYFAVCMLNHVDSFDYLQARRRAVSLHPIDSWRLFCNIHNIRTASRLGPPALWNAEGRARDCLWWHLRAHLAVCWANFGAYWDILDDMLGTCPRMLGSHWATPGRSSPHVGLMLNSTKGAHLHPKSVWNECAVWCAWRCGWDIFKYFATVGHHVAHILSYVGPISGLVGHISGSVGPMLGRLGDMLRYITWHVGCSPIGSHVGHILPHVGFQLDQIRRKVAFQETSRRGF